MNRLASILLLAFYAALGTGTLEYVHNLDHAAQDAREDAAARAAGQPVEQHDHNENNCETHSQIHLAIVLGGWAPIVVCLGLLTILALLICAPLIPRAVPMRIDCRGPPISLLPCL